MANIPPDVLGEIFYLTLRGPISNAQESLFPWSLGRVCKSWRHAFVTYPALWAFIALDVNYYVDDYAKLEKLCNRFRLCLQRSGNHPLSLILCARNKFHRGQQSPWIQVWKAFLSCSYRWKNIILCGEAQRFKRARGFPLLQSFRACCSKEYFDCDAFDNAPRLTQFGLAYYDNRVVVSHYWPSPLSQLTKFTLEIDGISRDALRVLFESLCNIQELCFKTHGCRSMPDISAFPPRCLEHLDVLEVPYIQILQVIKAPSLVELRLETTYGLYPYDDEMLDFYREVVAAFIGLSCHFRKLVLTGYTMEGTGPLMDSFPDLEELCIDDCAGWPYVLLGSFNEELESIASSHLFPKLRIFTLRCEPYRAESVVAGLTRILEFRNGVYIGKPSAIPLRPLEKIIIKRKRPWDLAFPSFYDSEPIPAKFEDAILEWAPFEVEVEFDHL